jgi:hypothetical protein
VADRQSEDPLSGKQRIELVLTLLVGLDRRVIHGQVFDPGRRQPLAFADLASLGSVIQEWLNLEVAALDDRGALEPVHGPSPNTVARWPDDRPGTAHCPGSDRPDWQ